MKFFLIFFLIFFISCENSNMNHVVEKENYSFLKEKRHSERLIYKANKHKKEIVKLWDKDWGDYNYGDFNYGSSVAIDSKGNIFVAGAIPDGNAFLDKLDNSGEELWIKKWTITSVDSIVIDSNDNIVIVGVGALGLIKLANNGRIIWTKREDLYNNLDTVVSTAIDSQDNIFITTHFRSNNKMNLIKLDSKGNELWTKNLEGNFIFTSITTDSSDNIIITGSTYMMNIFLIKLNSKGENLYSTKIWGTDNFDLGLSLTTDKNDNIFVTGFTNGVYSVYSNGFKGHHDIFLSKFK